jgi:predicted MFS family arabinose efflux permease
MSSGAWRRVLSEPRFRRLWLATAISELGSNIGRMAFVLVVHELARDRGEPPAQAVALVLLLETLPMLLLGPFAGALVDRWDRRWILVVCDALSVALLLAIPWLMELPVLWPLYGTATVFSAISTVFHPARQSAIPDLVDREDLAAANGLASATSSISLVLGMALGGVLIEGLGKTGCFLVDAGTFAVSGTMLLSLALPRHTTGLGAADFLGEVVQGVAFVLGRPLLVFLSAVFLFTYAFIGAWYPTLPAFVEEVLGRDPDRWVPATLSCFGVGGIAGAVLVPGLARNFHHGRLMLLVLFSAVAVVMTYAWNASPIASLLLIVLGGACVFSLTVLDTTILQEETPAGMRGRVFGARPPMQASGMLLGTGAVFSVADAVAPLELVRGAAVGYAAVAVAATLLLSGGRALLRRGS